MDAPAILARLRDKGPANPEELSTFAFGIANGEVTDAQAGAFAMAVLLNGLSEAETVALTMAMRDSGEVMEWDLPGPVTDKHSTGGIGDCVSLLLAPALAACGAFVPMISGRGLGHTGGTLDKLEAIPGFRTGWDREGFRRLVGENGAAIVAASGEIAPADKRLYGIRDVTGTVESVELITASILSKKLAAGLETLVSDVKVGSGAFMKDMTHAMMLAESLARVGSGAGCRTSALITDMSQPCVPSAGNALEVAEVMRVFEGETRGVIAELVCELGAEALVLSGLAEETAKGASMVRATLENGKAADLFGRMVSAQGGPADFVENWRSHLPVASVTRPVRAASSGYLSAIDGERLGRAVVNLGAGRLREDDVVDPAVGVAEIAAIGVRVEAGDTLCVVHAASEDQAERAVERIGAAMEISQSPVAMPKLIKARIGA